MQSIRITGADFRRIKIYGLITVVLIMYIPDQVKATREYLIKHFAFYYNSAYRVHKDAKYGAG